MHTWWFVCKVAKSKVLRCTETIPLLPCPQWLELADSTQCIGCDYCCEQCAGLKKQSCVGSSNPQQAQCRNWNDSTLSTASSSIFQQNIYNTTLYTIYSIYTAYIWINMNQHYSIDTETTNQTNDPRPQTCQIHSDSVLFSEVPSSLGHEHRKATCIVSVRTSQVLNHSGGLK